jgi:two-component system response regulator RegA
MSDGNEQRTPSTEPNPGSRLLLVDDDPAFLDILGRALTRRGFEVSKAATIAAAEQLAQTHPPEYAVVDLRLGQESGLVLVQRLRAIDKHTRILVLTGYASIATAVEAIKLGATHYLTKPVDAAQIIDALQRHEGDPDVAPAEHPLSPRRLEWEHLQKVLSEHQGNISATARALGMHRRTLQRKLNKYPSKR